MKRELAPGQADRICSEDELSEALAYLAYLRQLELRVAGDDVGPESLVLWRAFSRTKKGGAKPDFELRAADIFDAERKVRRAIDAIAAPS